ncbi:MAG TPA: alkaline phosphatase family protein [Terriglobales bacterium]|nr:alkaline phosphatase family protein [Terriglobales bacterium]
MRQRCLAMLMGAGLLLGARAQAPTGPTRHLLLLTMDGTHALDLEHYIAAHPHSHLAALQRHGVFYENASTSRPSDSFPGLMAMLTGGSPYSTGVWYETSYNRSLSPAGSHCATVGTEVALDESIDKDPNALDGGGGIDPAKLPLDPRKGCTPVYPHNLLRVNTIFDVLKARGLYTAFIDKQVGDEMDQGPTGHAVDDLYTPELHHAGASHSLPGIFHFDDLRTQALLYEIAGKDHTGTRTAPVPAIMGLTYQAITVGEKLQAGMGWTDASGTPSAALTSAFDHTDMEIGRLLAALRQHGLYDSTTVIVTAKHGQAPMDVHQLVKVSPSLLVNAINGVKPGLVADATGDDILLIWLRDQSLTAAAVRALEAVRGPAHIRRILSGEALRMRFQDPRHDSRTPDIIVEGRLGVIYTKPTNPTIAEHGGFSDEDTHVPILISHPGWAPRQVQAAVATTQIAPTIVALFGANPDALQAVRIEGTQILPGLPAGAVAQ